MSEEFVVLEIFQQEVSCCCPGQKHQHMIEFRPSDVWTSTNEQKYDDLLGWHFLVTVNKEFQFHIQVEEMEKLCNDRKICSVLELELKIIQLNHHVDKALDDHDKESFLFYANELSNVQKTIGH